MSEDGICDDHSEFRSQIGNRQGRNALGVERTIVTIEMNPMCFGKILPALGYSFVKNVNAVIVFGTNCTAAAPQEASCIPTEIEHWLPAPIGIVQLPIEVRKSAEISLRATEGSLRDCPSPKMNFFHSSAASSSPLSGDGSNGRQPNRNH